MRCLRVRGSSSRRCGKTGREPAPELIELLVVAELRRAASCAQWNDEPLV
jgi:hypothetical protein